MNPAEKKYCHKCKKEVSCHFDPIAHWEHLLATIITCGLWLPIWIGITFYPTSICDECKEPIYEKVK
jgi:hypothetical protein